MAEAIKMGGGGGKITNGQVITGYSENEKIKANTFVEYAKILEKMPYASHGLSTNQKVFFPNKGASFLQLNDKCVVFVRTSSSSSNGLLSVAALFANDDFGDFSTNYVELNTTIETNMSSLAFSTMLSTKKLSENVFLVVDWYNISIFSVDMVNKTITQLSTTTIVSLTGQSGIARQGFTSQMCCFFGATKNHIFCGGIENYSGASYPVSFIYFKINDDYSISMLTYCYSGWIATGDVYIPFIPEKSLDEVNNYCFLQCEYRYDASGTYPSPTTPFSNIHDFPLTSDNYYKFNIKLTESGMLLESVDSDNLLFGADSLNWGRTHLNINFICLLNHNNKQVIFHQYSNNPVSYSIVDTSNGHIVTEFTLAVQHSVPRGDTFQNVNIVDGHTVDNNKNMIMATAARNIPLYSVATANNARLKFFKKLVCDWDNLSINAVDVPLYLGDDYSNYIAPVFCMDDYFYQVPVSGAYNNKYTVARKNIKDDLSWKSLYKIDVILTGSGQPDYDHYKIAHSSKGFWLMELGTGYGSHSLATVVTSGIKNIVFNLFKKSVSKIIGVSKTVLKPDKSGKIEILKE